MSVVLGNPHQCSLECLTNYLPSMKFAAIILVIIPVVFAANSFRPFEIEKRVVGGIDVSIADSPFSVYVEVTVPTLISLLGSLLPFLPFLQLTCKFLCTGSRVSSKFVLTAAHCTQVPDYVASDVECLGLPKFLPGMATVSPSAVSITAGSATHTTGVGGGMSYTVRTVNAHPLYNPNTFNYDIAMIETTIVISVGAIIPLATADPAPGTNCFIDGWGLTSANGNPSPTLQRGLLKVIDRTACQASIGTSVTITNQMLCGKNTGVSSCSGDSGGPFSCGGVLYGATSFGDAGCNSSYASVYASVSDLDMKGFINSFISP